MFSSKGQNAVNYDHAVEHPQVIGGNEAFDYLNKSGTVSMFMFLCRQASPLHS